MGVHFRGDSFTDRLSTASTSVDIGGADYFISCWTNAYEDGADNVGVIVAKNSGAGTAAFSVFANASSPSMWYDRTGANNGSVAAGLLDSNFHHIVFGRYSGSTFMYFDAVSKTVTVTGTSAITAVTTAIDIGDDTQLATWANLLGDVADVRLYSNPSWLSEHATYAKIMYEAKGNDNITEGLIFRAPLGTGTHGATASTGIDVSSNSLHLTGTGTPTFVALPMKGF